MATDAAVTYVWERLLAFGYRRPELIGARWALRITGCATDKDAFQSAWDEKGRHPLRQRRRPGQCKGNRMGGSLMYPLPIVEPTYKIILMVVKTLLDQKVAPEAVLATIATMEETITEAQEQRKADMATIEIAHSWLTTP